MAIVVRVVVPTLIIRQNQETDMTRGISTISDVRIARICHEVNRAYCAALGDNSHLSWSGAPDWQRASAVEGVKFIRGNWTASPAASHMSWLEQKRREGWKYGPVKDVAKKEHPCFVPYDQLPVEQRAKDYIFGAVVRAVVSGGIFDLPSFRVESLQRTQSPKGFNQRLTGWSTSEWMVAVLGELGEAANLLKKANRERDGVVGNSETIQEIRQKFRDELADTFIYLDLLAASAGVDLAEAVRDKFDRTSDKIGYKA
jgi:NTP pyrophosphatase (non-canonical NTP hydrolase)